VGFYDLVAINYPLHTTTVIHIARNFLTSDASSTHGHFYTSNNKLRSDDIPFYPIDIYRSYGTNILNSMVNCSYSSS
jgi:hypothetical protein